MTNRCSVLVTTYNRPEALEKSLPYVCALGVPVVVLDDGSDDHAARENARICDYEGVLRLALPRNRGLACALNVGLMYLLADPAVHWISCFQDDVEVDPVLLRVLEDVQNPTHRPFLTGHDAAEHDGVGRETVGGVEVKLKENCRATHMHAHRDYWTAILPIPTRKLGAPCPGPGKERGIGSNVDYWIASRAPTSVVRTGKRVVCVPGLVRTFLWRSEDSCWNNRARPGEDGPLHQRALRSWSPR